MHTLPLPDATKYLPPDLDPGEAELLAGWGAYLQSRFPNPDRIGCPTMDVLERMAADLKNFHDRRVIDHTARCAPCSNQLRELIYQARHRS